jgi:HK97 family phage prohead protease
MTTKKTGKRAPRLDRATAQVAAEVVRSIHADGLRRKTVQATLKSVPSDGSGVFTAVVSTIGPPPDYDNEIISPGAFDATLTEASVEHPGELFPLYYMHDYQDPDNAIGMIERAVVTDNKLVVDGRLNIDSNTKAMSVYGRMLEGVLREFSISFAVVAEHDGLWEGKSVHYLDVLTILEVSVVMAGANPYTRLVALKHSPKVAAALKVLDAARTAGLHPFGIEAMESTIGTAAADDEYTSDELLARLKDIQGLWTRMENVERQRDPRDAELLAKLDALDDHDRRVEQAGSVDYYAAKDRDLDAQIRALEEEVRGATARDLADESAAYSNDNYAAGLVGPEDHAAREADARATERERFELREAERTEQAYNRDAADAARRSNDWRHAGVLSWYSETMGSESVASEGVSFRLPTAPVRETETRVPVAGVEEQDVVYRIRIGGSE